MAVVITVVKNSSQGLKAMTPATWNTECFSCFRLAPNPVDDAGLLSFATFSWLTPVMMRGYKHTLTVDTLPPLSLYDSFDTNAKRYQDLSGSHLERSPLWEGTRESLCVLPFPFAEISAHWFGGCSHGLSLR